ncbi:hypothetical protein SCB71_01795 [Herbiconiux sp. KACC 21604]|nr:hypothetical protein SCB71_01795 [Herbiconiux sp. KACC 21604]
MRCLSGPRRPRARRARAPGARRRAGPQRPRARQPPVRRAARHRRRPRHRGREHRHHGPQPHRTRRDQPRARRGQRLEPSELAGSTLYTSTEPCAMCSGAIYWSGIPAVVFALSEAALRDLVGEQEGVPTLSLPSREVFARGDRAVTLTGPVALPAATSVHEGFWH